MAKEVRDGKVPGWRYPRRAWSFALIKTWVVEKRFDTAGNRPTGSVGKESNLWVTDSNLNAFFKHDIETGEIVEEYFNG